MSKKQTAKKQLPRNNPHDKLNAELAQTAVDRLEGQAVKIAQLEAELKAKDNVKERSRLEDVNSTLAELNEQTLKNLEGVLPRARSTGGQFEGFVQVARNGKIANLKITTVTQIEDLIAELKGKSKEIEETKGDELLAKLPILKQKQSLFARLRKATGL